MNQSNKTPQNFKQLFWDIDRDRLDKDEDSMFIISRLLEKGRMDAVKWVYKTYGPNKILKVVNTSPNITSKTRYFWNLILTDDK